MIYIRDLLPAGKAEAHAGGGVLAACGGVHDPAAGVAVAVTVGIAVTEELEVLAADSTLLPVGCCIGVEPAVALVDMPQRKIPQAGSQHLSFAIFLITAFINSLCVLILPISSCPYDAGYVVPLLLCLNLNNCSALSPFNN